jgi:hypothetical protein
MGVKVEMTWAKETPGTHQYKEDRDDKGHRVLRTIYIEKWVIIKHFGGKVPKTVTVEVK